MNQLKLSCLANIENETIIRTTLVAFLLPLNPTTDELMELKTICAEAVVNAIIHGYPDEKGLIEIQMSYDDHKIVTLQIQDYGIGIKDIELAKQSYYSTKEQEEHSGMGFTIMETFSDQLDVRSILHQGTIVTLTKQLYD
ncbi:MAG: anti-sigma F factor [Erysipelotrichaceae bacterium]|nr:anti-sigma F factor [Erysipelotrichaceae bacterium]